MEIIQTAIPDVLEITPRVFKDQRGYFMETFRQSELAACGIDLPFVQDNQSMSSKGTLRGLHFQVPPHAQGKLVRVVRGAALDVAVDLRKASAHYGKWVAVELSESNNKQFVGSSRFCTWFSQLRGQYRLCVQVYSLLQQRIRAFHSL